MNREFLEKVRWSVRRRYATCFEWPDKEIKELGVVREWLRSMASRGEAEYSAPIPFSNDPPDCIARDRQGGEVAVEVTEFVSREAIETNLRRRWEDRVYRDWRPNQVITEINRIIQEKAGKTFNGGPYAKKILLIFTDEDVLVSRRFEYAKLLPKQSFGPVKQIDEVYFLFSYVGEAHPYYQNDDPLYDEKFDKGYPYIKLSLK